MKLYKTDKAVLSVQNDAGQFLNGLTSNTLDAHNNAFLNIHGKIVATFDQVKIGDDHFLLLIEAPFVDDVLKHVDRYMKLSKVEVKREDYNVYFDLEGFEQVEEDEYTIPQKKGKLIIIKRQLEAEVNDDDFTLFRLHHHIPRQGVDYKNEMILNVSTEDFVSFSKGCFLGQEPVSKVHSRSKPTWKLEVRYEQNCSEEEKAKMTSKTLEPSSGRHLGFVFVKNKD